MFDLILYQISLQDVALGTFPVFSKDVPLIRSWQWVENSSVLGKSCLKGKKKTSVRSIRSSTDKLTQVVGTLPLSVLPLGYSVPEIQ